jgi:peptide/nickel transport system substrate-binding protein
VASIDAADDRTLVVRTHRPMGALTRLLANVFIGLPEGADGSPVGTGPYRVHSWAPQEHTTLDAFPEHWRGRPAVDRVDFLAVPDASRRMELVRRGQADIAADVPGAEFALLGGDGEAVPRSGPGLRVLYLGLDCRPSRRGETSPFHDVRVRRAVSLAVDRDGLVRDALDGHGRAAGQLVAPGVFGHAPDLPAPAHDPAAARRLLAEAGFREGFDVRLDYAPAKYRGTEGVVAAVVSDLARVGIRVRPRPRTFPDLLDHVRAGLVPFYLLGALPFSGDAGLVYDYLLHTRVGAHGTLNGGRCSDPGVDALLDASAVRLDAGQRGELLQRIADAVSESVPVVPLASPSDLYAVRRGLRFTPRDDRRIRVADLRPESATLVIPLSGTGARRRAADGGRRTGAGSPSPLALTGPRAG